jgi:hypothetical protein
MVVASTGFSKSLVAVATAVVMGVVVAAAALGYMAAAAALDPGFFHIFHIISHFNLLFFCIFQIFSLFDLLFFISYSLTYTTHSMIFPT